MRGVQKMQQQGARVLAASIVVCAVVAAFAVSGASVGAQTPDDTTRINQIQMVGSHNSYHVAPNSVLLDVVNGFNDGSLGDTDDLVYTHSPLPVQFSDERVRQIELDVWVDSAGGLFSNPVANILTGTEGYEPWTSPELDSPGIKVLHIQDFDMRSTCLSLISCLQLVEQWSDANPWHAPIAILLELKADPIPDIGFELDFAVPEPWTIAAMDTLDAEIRSVMSPEDLITPDDVRGTYDTLEQAVLAGGWPTLGESRGKVMFMMDNAGGYRTDYLSGHPTLEERVLFTNSEPGQPDAAFVKMNDPFAGEQIRALVSAGYVVRTRADEPNEQASTGDMTMTEAALASGAQWVSTDYPVPGRTARYGTNYSVGLPDGLTVRCNPVNGPATCQSALLEIAPTTTTTTLPTESTTTTALASTTASSATSTTKKPTAPSSKVAAAMQPARPATAATATPRYTG